MEAFSCYVIMCNDNVEYVVFGTKEKAKSKMEELKESDKDGKKFDPDIASYDKIMSWRLREVDYDARMFIRTF
jgi:hypothetical protein